MGETTTVKEYEKNWPQIVAILIGGLAGITNGLLFSWPSPFLVKISQDKVNYDITEEQGSYFNTIEPLALIIACPIFSRLSDVIGRKKTFLMIVVPHIGSWLCAAYAKSVYVFYLSRILAGVADGCLYATLPTYIGEIASPSVRDVWGNAIATSAYTGDFLINIIGSYLGVTATSFVCLPLCVLFFVLFCMMPESPYFLIMKGREEQAKNSLRFLKRMQNIDEVYISLKNDVERQMSESGTWTDLVKIDSNRKALLAGLFLRVSQQLAGISVFLTFTQLIFQKSGGHMSHEVASILFMGICLVLNLLVVTFVVKRFRRISCYVTSTACCSVVLYILATYLYVKDNVELDVSRFTWIPFASIMSYLLFTSFGISVIPTLMLSELYSARIKSVAMTVLTITYGLSNFFTSTIFYNLNIIFGFYSPFYFFAICNTLSAIISYFVIPETKGKTLEEIQQSLKGNLKD